MLKWLAVAFLLLRPAVKLSIPEAIAAGDSAPIRDSGPDWSIVADLALGAIAYRLASKQAEVQRVLAERMGKLETRVEKLEKK